jgi:hypothetical protein
MRRKLLLTLSIMLLGNVMVSCMAQNDSLSFDLVKRNGHFYTSSTLNGVPVDIMIESGTPALMLSVDFYDKNKSTLSLDLKEASHKMRFLNQVYDIKFSGQGKLKFGNVVYDGPVFVLDGKTDVSLPIQYLKNPNDGCSIVEINLPANKLSLLSKGNLDVANYQSFPIRLKELGNMPVVSTELFLTIGSKNVSAMGDFIFDLGNGSLLFLMKQHEAIKTMIEENKIELKEARNMQGKVVAEGIFADNLTICGRKYSEVSIGVTDKLKSTKEAGFLGVKFMTMPIILDFGEKKMYIK